MARLKEGCLAIGDAYGCSVSYIPYNCKCNMKGRPFLMRKFDVYLYAPHLTEEYWESLRESYWETKIRLASN